MYHNKGESFTQQLNYNDINIDSRFTHITESNQIIFEQDITSLTSQDKQSIYDTYLDLLAEYDCVSLKLADKENTIKISIHPPNSVNKRKNVAESVANAIKNTDKFF